MGGVGVRDLCPGISNKLLVLMFGLLGGSLLILASKDRRQRVIVMRALGLISVGLVIAIMGVFAFRSLAPNPVGSSATRPELFLHAGESTKIKSLLQSLAAQLGTRGELSDADVAALNKLKTRLSDREFVDAVSAVLDLAARDRADERAGKPARLRDDFRRDLEAVFGEPAPAADRGG